MPRVRADELRRIGCLLFERVGCTLAGCAPLTAQGPS